MMRRTVAVFVVVVLGLVPVFSLVATHGVVYAASFAVTNTTED